MSRVSGQVPTSAICSGAMKATSATLLVPMSLSSGDVIPPMTKGTSRHLSSRGKEHPGPGHPEL